MPTAWAAPPLLQRIAASSNPPVWPDASGTTHGIALAPLHPSVPDAARGDDRLWELLALVDAIRIGNARERSIAGDELKKRLNGHWPG